MKAYDSGLQPERTTLAWTRTALGFGANALLLMRLGAVKHSDAVFAVGGILLAATVALVWFAMARRVMFLGPREHGMIAPKVLATCAALAGLAGFVSILGTVGAIN